MEQRWYIVQALSNFEKKVAEHIRLKAAQKGLSHQIEDILVPVEQVMEMRRGRRVAAERKFFPGYVLVKTTMSDEIFHLIKNTPKVSGFLGNDKRPSAISDAEAGRIIGQVKEGVDKPKNVILFEIGEKVKVTDGPFASFDGFVEEIDDARSRVKVAVTIFGRATPVELEFTQVAKSA